MRSSAACARQRGFTLVELIVTISLMALLMGLGLPSFREWIVNSKIRTTADTLQNALRLAQTEAVRRNREVVFALTNASPGLNANAAAGARNWMIQTVPFDKSKSLSSCGTDCPEYVAGGTFNDAQSGISVDGAGATCFNSMGRLMADTAPGVGVACTLTTSSSSSLQSFTVSGPDTSYRKLMVTLSLGGQVRMCDTSRTLSAASPDGCP